MRYYLDSEKKIAIALYNIICDIRVLFWQSFQTRVAIVTGRSVCFFNFQMERDFEVDLNKNYYEGYTVM